VLAQLLLDEPASDLNHASRQLLTTGAGRLPRHLAAGFPRS